MYCVLKPTCVFILAAAAVAAQNPSTTIPAESVTTSGMAGLAEGQAAQLNVLNPGVAATAAAGAACSALLSFRDDQGQLLKSATVNVAPGASAAIRLDADVDLKLAAGERREIRAIIQTPAVPPPATTPTAAPCKLIPNVEVLDRITGRTQVILGAAHLVAGVPVPASSN